MKIYRAEPHAGGFRLSVRLAGSAQLPETEPRALDLRRDLADYTNPQRQIALALLADALDDELRALSYSREFERRIVAHMDPARPWELNSRAVERECFNIDMARRLPLGPGDNENLSHPERVARAVSSLRVLLETYPLDGALPVCRAELSLVLGEFAEPPTAHEANQYSGTEREIARGLASMAETAGVTTAEKRGEG